MNYQRGLKALGLSILAALGLMVTTAGGAQASGTFLIQGLAPPWTHLITGAGENNLDSYLLILKLNVKISCHAVSLTGTIKNTGHGHVSFKLSSCLVTDSASESVGCTLAEPIEFRYLVLAILHNSKPYLLFSPLDGLAGGTIKASGEFCTLPKEATIKGSFVTWISNPDGDDVTKLISTKAIPPAQKPTMLELFPGDALMYGSHVMHLIFDANVALAGPGEGRAWGAT